MSSEETWATVEAAPLYEVSTLGRVRRTETVPGWPPGGVMTPFPNANGYMRVRLYIRGEGQGHIQPTVHSLVAEAFLGDRPAGYQINHKDGNKLNNRVDNLEYATREQNVAHAQKNGLIARGESIASAKLTRRDVLEIRRRSRQGETTTSIARDFPIGEQATGKVVNGETWSHVRLRTRSEADGGEG